MESNDFKISQNVVWFLVIGNTLLMILGAFAKLNHLDYPEFLLTFGLMMFFSTWIIILNDMINNKIYNKSFWVLSLFIIPFISFIFYIIQRKRLIRLGHKLS